MLNSLQIPIEDYSRVVDALPEAARCCICEHHCLCVKKRTLDVYRLYPHMPEHVTDVSVLLCDYCIVNFSLALMHGNNVVMMNGDKMVTIGKKHWV